VGVYVRDDSPVYWLLLDGYRTASGAPLRERTKIRRDAKTALQRKDNRALAEQEYHARMTALAKGAPIAAAGKVPTFAERAAWFTKHQLPHRRGREREAPLIPKLVAVLGRLPISAVTRTAVTELWITPRLSMPTVIKKKKYTAGRSVQAGARTVNREVAVIKAIVQSAVPDFLEVSPLYGMPLVPTKTPKRRIMTEDEEARLLAVLAVDDKALFLLGLDSLVRLMDLLDVTRADDRGATLYVADPKAGGGFAVPISTRARQALDAHYAEQTLAKDAYIFGRRRAAKTERDRRSAIRKMLAEACAAATPPIPYGRRAGGLTFHWATRRTGLTRMLTRGVDLGTAQKVGRWKTPGVVLGVYHELVDEAAHAAVNAVGPDTRRSRSTKNS
jgi:integrase